MTITRHRLPCPHVADPMTDATCHSKRGRPGPCHVESLDMVSVDDFLASLPSDDFLATLEMGGG